MSGPLLDSIADLRSLVDRLNFLHKVSQKISETKPLSKLLNEILEDSKIVMDVEASSLLLYDKKEKKLYFQVATGSKGKSVKRHSVKLGGGLAGWVAKHKQPLLIDDCYNDPRFDDWYDKKLNYKTRNMICVPMMRKKKLIGVIQVINKNNGKGFAQQDLNIFETLASQCAIAIENARLVVTQVEKEALERELDTARTIQQNLLPDKLPDYDDLDTAAMLVPAKEVGGDYYNVLRINDKTSLFLVADVAGKGIPAALIVSTIFSYLQTFIKLEDSFDLMRFVKSLNRVLMDSTTFDKFVTVWIGVYHHQSKELESVNAGHNPTYLFRKGISNPQILSDGGIFLGSLEVPFEIESIRIGSGDVLLFYSDGVTEAWNKKQEDYGEERLIQLVSKNRKKKAADLLDLINKDLKQHAGKAVQSDDITCGIVKFK